MTIVLTTDRYHSLTPFRGMVDSSPDAMCRLRLGYFLLKWLLATISKESI